MPRKVKHIIKVTREPADIVTYYHIDTGHFIDNSKMIRAIQAVGNRLKMPPYFLSIKASDKIELFKIELILFYGDL